MVALTCRQYDEPSAIRHGGGVRRIPGRTLGGPRTRRSNMHFSSSSGLSALSPSGRESVDPIAELLSQLSGVRRGGPPTSQLQQLQMQMQLDRQQVTVREGPPPHISIIFVCIRKLRLSFVLLLRLHYFRHRAKSIGCQGVRIP